MIELSTQVFAMLIGSIGTLIGLLLTSLWLQPKIIRNLTKIESIEKSDKSQWIKIEDMRKQINDIYIEVVKNKHKK